MAARSDLFNSETLAYALGSVPADTQLWVAFSGGADSTALLAALQELFAEQPNRLRAIHVDHGVQPDATRWAQHCTTICSRLSVPLETVRLSLSVKQQALSEAALRQYRYAALESYLQPGDWLVTAHHARDQAETLLLHLMRGSGVEGLAGMAPRRAFRHGWLVRPLLETEPQALRDYLRARNLDWIEDASNHDHAIDRNFVRHRVLPELETRWPSATDLLVRSARYQRETASLLAHLAQERLERWLESENVLDLGATEARRADVLKLVVRHWLRQHSAPSLPGKRLEELCRQVASADDDNQVCIRWAGWSLHLFQQQLWLQPQAIPADCPDLSWNGREPVDLGPGLGVLSFSNALAPPAPGFRIRARTGQDKLRLDDGRKRQSVKNLLQSRRVPPWLRGSIPLLELAGHPVALGDWWISSRLRSLLQEKNAKLVWQPADPLLQQARARCLGKTVEP